MTSLDELHKERAALLKKESALWERRQKLAAADRAADAAERALSQAGVASATEMSNWQAQGCTGPMPGTDSTELARLHEASIRAQHTKRAAGAYSHEADDGLARGAKGQVEREANEIAEALYANRIAIEDAVARAMAEHFQEMADRVAEIEAEKNSLQAELLGGRDCFTELAETWRKTNGTAREAFHEARRACVSGLDGPKGAFALARADLGMIRAAGLIFDELCGHPGERPHELPRVRKIIDKREQYEFPQPQMASPPPLVERDESAVRRVSRGNIERQGRARA